MNTKINEVGAIIQANKTQRNIFFMVLSFRGFYGSRVGSDVHTTDRLNGAGEIKPLFIICL